MKGLEINYNFNRKHMALGKKTPAEVAIPQLELGVNNWLDLIKISKCQLKVDLRQFWINI